MVQLTKTMNTIRAASVSQKNEGMMELVPQKNALKSKRCVRIETLRLFFILEPMIANMDHESL
jgi:hypothetical protein